MPEITAHNKVGKKYPIDLLFPLRFWSACVLHFTIPWSQRRGVLNCSEVTQLTLAGHMKMTTWPMQYTQISFILHMVFKVIAYSSTYSKSMWLHPNNWFKRILCSWSGHQSVSMLCLRWIIEKNQFKIIICSHNDYQSGVNFFTSKQMF